MRVRTVIYGISIQIHPIECLYTELLLLMHPVNLGDGLPHHYATWAKGPHVRCNRGLRMAMLPNDHKRRWSRGAISTSLLSYVKAMPCRGIQMG